MSPIRAFLVERSVPTLAQTVLCLSLVAALGACGGEDEAAPPARRGPSGPTAVDVVTVRPTTLEDELAATGELRADEEVELRVETSGRIVDLRLREGQRVRRGDLLLRLADDDLVAELRRARARRELAGLREGRTRSLLDDGAVSQAVYDEAASELTVLDAEIELLEARRRETRLLAPFSGQVGLRSVSEGSYVTPQSQIARLQSLDPIKLDFAVPEKHAADLRTGAQVEFQTADGVARRGEVYAIEPQVDSATRTVRVRARSPNPDGLLVPGAFARVRVVLDRRENVLQVPAIALVPGLRSTKVFVVEDGTAESREVEVGRRTEGRVEILEGLEPGDRVVTTGVQQMRDGATVQATEVEIDESIESIETTERDESTEDPS